MLKDFLTHKWPELLLLTILVPGGAWIMSTLMEMKENQGAIRAKVAHHEERLDRMARASEAYGVKVAKNELDKPVETVAWFSGTIYGFDADLKQNAEYVTIVWSPKSSKQLVFRSTDYNKALSAYGIARAYLYAESGGQAITLGSLDEMCRMQGHRLDISKYLDKDNTILVRSPLQFATEKIATQWELLQPGNYFVSVVRPVTWGQKQSFSAEDICRELTTEMIKSLVGNP